MLTLTLITILTLTLLPLANFWLYTACMIAQSAQLLGAWHSDPIFGSDVNKTVLSEIKIILTVCAHPVGFLNQ